MGNWNWSGTGTGTTIDLSQASVMPTDVVSCMVSSTDTSNATGTGQRV